jgi:uncharacterized protein YkwD
MLARYARLFVVVFTAIAIAFALSSGPVAAKPMAKKYSIDIKYVRASDTVWGSAKNVGGTYVMTLEWRKGMSITWQTLTSSDVQNGKKKSRVGNVVHSPGSDFSGQWRACVVRRIYTKYEKKTCGKVIDIASRSATQVPSDEPADDVPADDPFEDIPIEDVPDDVDNPPVDPALLEREIFALTNAARVAEGLGTLTEHECLDRFANAQAKAQADELRMFHQDMSAIGGSCQINTLGENVAVYFREAETVQEAWMSSPGHRANILTPSWTYVGVGVAVDVDGMPYYSVVFGYILPPPYIP